MSTANGHHQDPAGTDDSDAESDAAGDSAYYHPISAESDSEDAPDPSPAIANGHHRNPSPNDGNGISALDLNGEEEEEEEVVAVEREREASILMAFREDERRRSAPLTPENAARVRDAMRAVSLPGSTPGWAEQVPEDRWVDRLRRLREQNQEACRLRTQARQISPLPCVSVNPSYETLFLSAAASTPHDLLVYPGTPTFLPNLATIFYYLNYMDFLMHPPEGRLILAWDGFPPIPKCTLPCCSASK